MSFVNPRCRCKRSAVCVLATRWIMLIDLAGSTLLACLFMFASFVVDCTFTIHVAATTVFVCLLFLD